MPLTPKLKLLLLAGMAIGGSPKYLLRDDFTDTLASGSVNGTPAVPGPGTRAVVDTNSKISLSGGLLNFATGAAVSDGLWLNLMTRTAGRILVAKMNIADTAGAPALGWGILQSGAITDRIALNALVGLVILNAATASSLVLGSYTANVSYTIAGIMRSSGICWFIKGGVFTNWTLLAITDTGSANCYPGSQARNITTISNNNILRVPVTLWLPTPLASDGMTSATLTDGAGHAETTGIGSGGANVPWATAATWAVAGGVAANTPVPGAEGLTNGNMETGDPPTGWIAQAATLDGVADERTGGAGVQSIDILGTGVYPSAYKAAVLPVGFMRFSGWGKNIAGNAGFFSPAPGFNAPAVGDVAWVSKTFTFLYTTANPYIQLYSGTLATHEARFDDISCKPLTFSELVRPLNTVFTADVVAQVKVAAFTAYTQAGMAVRLNSSTTPTAGIIAYFDGWGDIKCYEFSGSTWTQLFTAAKAFTANGSLQLITDGANIRLIHLTSAGAATLIGSTAAATITTGGYHGLLSTDPGNTLDNLVIYPRGTGGEYSILDRWSK